MRLEITDLLESPPSGAVPLYCSVGTDMLFIKRRRRRIRADLWTINRIQGDFHPAMPNAVRWAENKMGRV